jgi:8-oxo-dGTP pyrophosphatase MutT (NUDIX family)
MIKYVGGFLFSENEKYVALIKKNRPDWQVGKLNCIGRKIEDNETIQEAMYREFFEETGVEITNWKHFATLKHTEYELYFFRFFGDEIYGTKTLTDESVFLIEVENIKKHKRIPNLDWLIPMALDKTIEHATIENIGN